MSFEKFKENFYLLNHRGGTFIVPIVLTVLIGIILVVLHDIFRYHDFWTPLKSATGNAAHFCELNRFGEIVVQPSNTWSNFGFLLVGITCVSIAIRDHKYHDRLEVSNLLAKRPAFSFLFGISVIFLFIGSFMYHASLTWFFQKLDQNGMYFIMISLFAYNVYKIKPIIRMNGKERSSHPYIIVGAIAVMILFFTWVWRINILYLWPSIIILFFATNIVNNRMFREHRKPYTKYMKAAVLCMLSSTFIWILDITDIICIPTSIFQGHALWHLLNATCIMVIYLYYRGEHFSETTTIKS